MFRDLPIRLKVVLLIAVSSAVGLSLAALAVVVYELTTFRPRVLRDATTQAAIVRINTIPALRFVDDNAMVRTMAVRALRLAGYTVLEAERGEAALACSEGHQGRIDVLLTDVVMPGIKGGISPKFWWRNGPTYG
ncbi:MAG: response regulator [Gemmatimonadales bacterium]